MSRTGFRAEQNGFAFVNSWSFDLGEKQHMRKSAKESVARHNLAANIGAPSFGFGDMLSQTALGWLDAAMPDYYGMCGGMAFTAADYFRARIPLPRGSDYSDIPPKNTPRGKALRDHLWERQMQSFRANLPTMLGWMIMLHIPLPFGGPDWVLERTRREFAELKGYIDQDKPWPICLVGSSTSPFDQHQVLATGYDDHGDGTSVVYIYDMNSPGREHTIALDMRRNDQLIAQESSPNPARGALRGFFCEQYTPASPPALPPD